MINKKLQKQIQEKILELFPTQEFTVPDVESKLKKLGYKRFFGLLPIGANLIYFALYDLEDEESRVHSWWGKDSMERSQMLFKVIHQCD